MMTVKHKRLLQVPMNGSVLHQYLSQEQAHHFILSMAGEYAVHFRFEEIYSLTQNYDLQQDKPQFAYETVIVVENTPNKIVLQHILVAGDRVIKHWRQDWQYQPTTLWSYVGDYQWQTALVSAEQSEGCWLQTVWQVDDSPRYAGLGKWVKENGVILWASNETYRPLPRREYTQRNDYDVIIGQNRHVITPQGWIHEQDNIKFDSKTQTALAREKGVNCYQRIEDYNFSLAYQYWEKHHHFWHVVREKWEDIISQQSILTIKKPLEGQKPHYIYFTDLAKQAVVKRMNELELARHLDAVFEQILVKGK